MSAKDILRRNKTSIQSILSADQVLILNKVYETSLITQREYNNLKGIYKENVEGHVIKLVDTVMDKGDERCQQFLNLLETDDDIKETFPNLRSILSQSRSLPAPVQETSLVDNSEDGAPGCKKTKMAELYPVNSNPRGICLIMNNMNFKKANTRHGTEKDAESLAEVFSWLGFTVLQCEDKTQAEMSNVLQCFSTLSDKSELQQLGLKEWSGGFKNFERRVLEHGDVFICCILSHGNTGVVYGTDSGELPIKDITRTFKLSQSSPLNGRPKIFLIQACQGNRSSPAVTDNLEIDDGSSASIPEDADVLVAVASVEDYVSVRDPKTGSWFIQSLCQELKEGCKRGDEIHSILQRVNNEVSQKQGFCLKVGSVKQMPEIRYTLRKELRLSPVN